MSVLNKSCSRDKNPSNPYTKFRIKTRVIPDDPELLRDQQRLQLRNSPASGAEYRHQNAGFEDLRGKLYVRIVKLDQNTLVDETASQSQVACGSVYLIPDTCKLGT